MKCDVMFGEIINFKKLFKIVVQKIGNDKFHDMRCEILLRNIEKRQEEWKQEKLHKDAIRDKLKDAEMALELNNCIPTEKGLVELLRMLQALQTNDNCDTTHRFYLTGEQYDNETFEVQRTYRYCVKCDRFYNVQLLSQCYCGLIKAGEIMREQ